MTCSRNDYLHSEKEKVTYKYLYIEEPTTKPSRFGTSEDEENVERGVIVIDLM